MFLILFRHGLAEKRNEAIVDDDRALVDKGIQKTKDVADQLKWILPHEVTLYSSPLIRAYQTAEILAATFNKIPIHLSDELATGDFKTFLANMNEETPVQIAVGHEPFFSEWVYELTKVNIEFKKSSFVLLSIQKDSTEFLTYATPKNISKIQKDASYYRSLLDIIDILNLPHYAEDRHTLHQFRVRLRHMDTLFYHLNTISKHDNHIALHKNLISMLELSHELRETDALIEVLESLEISDQLKHLIFSKRLSLLQTYQTKQENEPFLSELALNYFVVINEFYHLKNRKKNIKESFDTLLKKTKKFLSQMDKQSHEDLHDLKLMLKIIIYSAHLEMKTVYSKNESLIDFSKDLKDMIGSYLDYHLYQRELQTYIEEDPSLKDEVLLILEKLDKKSPSLLTLSSMIFRFKKTIE